MLLLQANNIQKSYGTRTVLDFERFQLYRGDRIGVVGKNGAGKSTLLGVLSREIAPDRGTVTGDFEISYIRQSIEFDPHKSGGENVKQEIREQTHAAGQVLFADEPTANLDAQGQKWVRERLRRADTLLLVSHDRALLDELCTKIVEIRDGGLREYSGNYSNYEEAIQQEKGQHELEYQQFVHKKTQLEKALSGKQRQAAGMTKAPSRMGNSEARLHKNTIKERRQKVEQTAKGLKSRLERMEKVEKLREPPKMRIDFSLTNPPGNKLVIQAENLSFAYDGGKQIFDDASFVVPNRAKIHLRGNNGSGKTTLLRMICEGHDAVTCAPKLRLGYLHQTFGDLDPARTVLDNVLLTSIQDHASVRSVLAGLLFYGDDIYKKAEVLSGGEKMRLSLAKLLTGEANALMLDEPTNYLDLQAIQAVQIMIQQYPGTVILVSHDERFVQEITDRFLEIRDGKVFAGTTEAKKGPAPADKMILEMRLTRLVAEISSAPPDEKTRLEARYHETLDQLKAL